MCSPRRTCAAPTAGACLCCAGMGAARRCVPPTPRPRRTIATPATPPDRHGPVDLFDDYTLRIVALGSAILGGVSGSLGSLAVLRKQSLLGDAISHAALPGIVLAFLLTGSRSTLVLVLGAAIAGWVGTLAVIGVVGSTRV